MIFPEIKESYIGGTELMLLNLKNRVFPLASELKDWNWLLSPGKWDANPEDKNIAYIHLSNSQGNFQFLEVPKFINYSIFISYYQYQRFFESHPKMDTTICRVIKNSIDPIETTSKNYSNKIKMIFHCEPYRGLDRLVMALGILKHHQDIELHVFGNLDINKAWGLDLELENSLKELCSKDSRVVLRGRTSNQEVRDFLKEAHIFAYPSTYEEVSCISLIEAMSAGLYCITNSYGALPETGIGLTKIYPFNVNPEQEAQALAKEIEKAINTLRSGTFDYLTQAAITNKTYSHEERLKEWISFSNDINH
jgi:glycosyltransferase involved in cell wall biosynthesis